MVVGTLEEEIEFFNELEKAAGALVDILNRFEKNTRKDDNELEVTLRHLDSVDTYGGMYSTL